MKKLLYFAFITGILFTACSKKNDTTPKPDNSVTINGTAYSTGVIGSQTWTSANFNGPGGVNYNNDAANNAAYGKLYTVAEAKAISLPAGWRLPTGNDFVLLLVAIGKNASTHIGSYYGDDPSGLKLMATTDWQFFGSGSNSTGFNALPAGFYNNIYNGGTPGFAGKGDYALFLTSTGVNLPDNFYIYKINPNPEFGFGGYIIYATDRASVRFVKDN